MNVPSVVFQANAEYGRIKIFADVDKVTSENVIELFSTAYMMHNLNAIKEEQLYQYERGVQDILAREKDIRSNINEKLVINKASQILDMHVGYCFGNPITFVQRGKVEEDLRKPETTEKEDNLYIAMINKMMAEQSKAKKDTQLARDYMTCGLGYQMVWKNEKKWQYSPFKIATLNPRTTFMIYKNDAWQEPLMGCSYIIDSQGSITATCYTEDTCYTIRGYSTTENTSPVLKQTVNVLGLIPIVEFEYVDRMGVFEKAIPILNELNLVNSDRINDISQHVQSLLWMHNCLLDDEKRKQLIDGNGVIMTKSNGDGKEAKIVYLSQALDQSGVQTLSDTLKQEVLEITSTPSWQEASGGSTTGAMQLSNGWQSLELSAKSVEQLFAEPESRILALVAKVIELDKRGYAKIKDIDISDIEPHFTRNKNYDLVSKTNALSTMINSGVDGLWAFQTVGLFSDAEQAYVDSREMIKKIQESKVKQDSPNNNNNANASKDEEGNGGENNEPKDKTEESLQPSAVAQVENT